MGGESIHTPQQRGQDGVVASYCRAGVPGFSWGSRGELPLALRVLGIALMPASIPGHTVPSKSSRWSAMLEGTRARGIHLVLSVLLEVASRPKQCPRHMFHIGPSVLEKRRNNRLDHIASSPDTWQADISCSRIVPSAAQDARVRNADKLSYQF